MSRIVLVALACLLAASAYVLQRSQLRAEVMAREVADSLGQQLEMQLLQSQAGLGRAQRFPDFSLWKQTGSVSGICIRFVPLDGAPGYNLCNGAKPSRRGWPQSFEALYRVLFGPGIESTRPVSLNGRVYGALSVSPSEETTIARAWDDILDLIGLSAVTVSAVAALVFLALNTALRPATDIVKGLQRIENGELSYRLPAFELLEWRRITAAVNRLTATQQQLLRQRQRLAVKLMTLQEQERRMLARELHDEFGQCLAAINAVTASISQTAEQQCPELVAEIGQIGSISRHMMAGVRGLLGRLRPAELEDLGLVAGLNGLIAGWNTHGDGRTRYRLTVRGDCAGLPEPLAAALFRIVQECLTNVAKHASASNAEVTLVAEDNRVRLTVSDDGVAAEPPAIGGSGIGLLGIRERVDALQGGLTLGVGKDRGLIVTVVLPAGNVAGAVS